MRVYQSTRYTQKRFCPTKPSLYRRAQITMATATPIQDYIDRHGLQKKVEDVLNSCVKEKPADPLAFMVCSTWGSPAWQWRTPERVYSARKGRLMLFIGIGPFRRPGHAAKGPGVGCPGKAFQP